MYIDLQYFTWVSRKSAENRKSVEFTVTSEQLSFLDQNLNRIVEPGTFAVMVGSSSKDIRLKGEFEVK